MPRAGERAGRTAGWPGAALACDRVVPDLRRVSTGAVKHTATRSPRAVAVPPTTAQAWTIPARPAGTTPPATQSPIKPIAVLMSYAATRLRGQQAEPRPACPRSKRDASPTVDGEATHVAEMSHDARAAAVATLSSEGRIYLVTSSPHALVR